MLVLVISKICHTSISLVALTLPLFFHVPGNAEITRQLCVARCSLYSITRQLCVARCSLYRDYTPALCCSLLSIQILHASSVLLIALYTALHASSVLLVALYTEITRQLCVARCSLYRYYTPALCCSLLSIQRLHASSVLLIALYTEITRQLCVARCSLYRDYTPALCCSLLSIQILHASSVLLIALYTALHASSVLLVALYTEITRQLCVARCSLYRYYTPALCCSLLSIQILHASSVLLIALYTEITRQLCVARCSLFSITMTILSYKVIVLDLASALNSLQNTCKWNIK